MICLKNFSTETIHTPMENIFKKKFLNSKITNLALNKGHSKNNRPQENEFKTNGLNSEKNIFSSKFLFLLYSFFTRRLKFSFYARSYYIIRIENTVWIIKFKTRLCISKQLESLFNSTIATFKLENHQKIK